MSDRMFVHDVHRMILFRVNSEGAGKTFFYRFGYDTKLNYIKSLWMLKNSPVHVTPTTWPTSSMRTSRANTSLHPQSAMSSTKSEQWSTFSSTSRPTAAPKSVTSPGLKSLRSCRWIAWISATKKSKSFHFLKTGGCGSGMKFTMTLKLRYFKRKNHPKNCLKIAKKKIQQSPSQTIQQNFCKVQKNKILFFFGSTDLHFTSLNNIFKLYSYTSVRDVRETVPTPISGPTFRDSSFFHFLLNIFASHGS